MSPKTPKNTSSSRALWFVLGAFAVILTLALDHYLKHRIARFMLNAHDIEQVLNEGRQEWREGRGQ